jgi:ferredoxin
MKFTLKKIKTIYNIQMTKYYDEYTRCEKCMKLFEKDDVNVICNSCRGCGGCAESSVFSFSYLKSILNYIVPG